MKSNVSLGYSTFPSEESAQRVCEVLLQENYIACANIIGPVRSLYKWNGLLKNELEWIAILKTADLKRSRLKERLPGIHPYQHPALVFLKIDDGLPAFLQWIFAETV